MARQFTETKLVVASHNGGKVAEISALLQGKSLEITSAGALGLASPAETGVNFIENAEIKSRAAATSSGLVALSDDSGLCVHALGGEPGIHSARWAETGKRADFQMAMGLIEEKMIGQTDRGAHFVCAMSLGWPDGHCETFEETMTGKLVWPGRGELGFGYDPVFQPD
ncbi:MAG: non-canonical purine NTP pyrophosphatase, partial [Rhodospirillales bacterium]|nr:non-canonical purine NTP pyrophosphatase [Rhodospirillales bacterium]